MTAKHSIPRWSAADFRQRIASMSRKDALHELNRVFDCIENMSGGYLTLDAYLDLEEEIKGRPEPEPEPKMSDLGVRAVVEEQFKAASVALKEYFEEQREAADARMASVLRRLDALEAKALTYRGAWAEGKSYISNDLVTHQGTLWICLDSGSTRPGTSGWRLMVKHQEGGR